MTRALLVLGAALSLLAPAAAPGAVVTRNYAFTASGFQFAFGGSGPAPVDPASGTIMVRFDDATDQENVTTGISFRGFNFAVDTIDAAPGYSFSVADNLLLVGTVCRCGSGGVDAIGPGTDNFLLGIVNPAGDAGFAFFAFSQADFSDLALATEGAVAAVPEPAGWALMIIGFGAIGGALRRASGTRIRERRQAEAIRLGMDET